MVYLSLEKYRTSSDDIQIASDTDSGLFIGRLERDQDKSYIDVSLVRLHFPVMRIRHHNSNSCLHQVSSTAYLTKFGSPRKFGWALDRHLVCSSFCSFSVLLVLLMQSSWFICIA